MLVKKMWLFLLSFLVIFGVSTAQYEENHGLSVVPEKAEENKNGFFEEVEHMDSVNKEQSDVIMEEENSLADHVFIPTSEWQTVKPGQHVPRGLHVRLDVSTGRKEAKLMEDDGGSKYHVWDNGERKGVVNADHKYFTIEEIKSALKEMKNDNAATEKEDQNQGADNEGDGAVKSQFRPYAELKREFESLNMHIKTDIEIMKELLTEYRMVNSSAERRLAILEELEYYVHQIDNAQNFVDLGGFKILREVFNDSSSEFRAVAGFLLGSACQSNPKVQVAAVEYGFLHHIVQNFGKERDFSVRKKYLYSISAVLRQFPYAQKKFLELGGAEIFGQIFNEVGQDKQKVKIVTLLFDLIMEKQYVEKTEKTDSERLKQYEEVQLLETLVDKGWCSLVPKLLNLPDWDSQEKVLLAMKLMFSDCRTEFLKSLRTLNQLKARYEQELSSYEQAANDYLKGLLTTVNQMISTWFYHEEL